jgi:hypothetical protein
MNKTHRISGILLAIALFAPALAAAQVSMTGSTTVDTEVQSLLSQITALQQQLKSLIQTAAPSTTPSTWGQGWGHGNASSTPTGQGGSQMGNCGNFDRNLSVGSQGDDVMQLQQMLQGDGFLSASSTGFFGSLTARALGQFQSHFGIASSSSGSFFGPLTRMFVQNHCQGGQMGSSTGMMGPMRPAGEGWQNGSSTPSWGSQGGQPIFHGMMGSSTNPQMPPCPNEDQGAAAALFVPHVILPPCGNGQGQGPQGSQQGPGSDQ